MSNEALSSINYDDFIAKSYTLEEKAIYNQTIKRVLDIVLALIGMVICLPIIIIFGILIKLESNGPIIFKQERNGMDGQVFHIYKLRSMYADAEKNGPMWAEQEDKRITKVGKFIRRTRIDELPQFINIINGEMSMVGPRPERPIFTEKFNEEIPGFIYRLCVKPGLTGLAQVNGGYELTPEQKLKLDLMYICDMSLILDLKIILMTVAVILTGNGAR